MHYNIQGGISNKLNDLNIFLDNSSVKIICLNEHWLQTNKLFLFNKIQNFNLASSYCRLSSRGGGTCILVHSTLNYVVRQDIESLAEDNVFEVSCIEINEVNAIVISLYRKPDYSNYKLFLEKLERLLICLSKEVKTKSIFIAADFNLDILNYNSNCLYDTFLNLIRYHGFVENFKSYTRITKTSQTCIDNILSNSLFDNIRKPTLNLDLGISDHRALFICIEEFTRKISKPNIVKRSVSKKKQKTFCSGS